MSDAPSPLVHAPATRLGTEEPGGRTRARPSTFGRVLVALIRGYQVVVAPWLGRSCRFEPSCSRYALACVEARGALRGSLLSVKRLCKCHPFHPGGYDPPPDVG